MPTSGARSSPFGAPSFGAPPNGDTNALRLSSRHGAVCNAVAFAVALAVVHVGSSSHGGRHDATRHTTGPTHASSWWHCPYRNWLQQTRRWSHEPDPQWQPQL